MKTWLAGEDAFAHLKGQRRFLPGCVDHQDQHGAAQRMAGMAFGIRVASAGVTFLSQIALARWITGPHPPVYATEPR